MLLFFLVCPVLLALLFRVPSENYILKKREMKNEANRRKLSKDVIYTIHTSFPLHSNIQNGFPKAPSCCGDYIKIIICRLICLYRCLNLDCSQVCFGNMEKQIALQGVKWRESTGENQCVKNLKRVWGGCTLTFMHFPILFPEDSTAWITSCR